jgi:hypothetical protein
LFLQPQDLSWGTGNGEWGTGNGERVTRDKVERKIGRF